MIDLETVLLEKRFSVKVYSHRLCAIATFGRGRALRFPCAKMCFFVTLSHTHTHACAQSLFSLLQDFCFTTMPSACDQKKRDLVKVLKEFIHAYACNSRSQETIFGCLMIPLCVAHCVG